MPYRLPDIVQKAFKTVSDTGSKIISGGLNQVDQWGNQLDENLKKQEQLRKETEALKLYNNTPPDPNMLNPLGSENVWKTQNNIKGAITILPDIQPLGVGTTISGFMKQPTGKPFYSLIVNTAQQKGLHPALAAAGFMNESGLDPNTPDGVNYDKYGNEVSRDRGIAQINNIAHPEVTEAQARDHAFAIPWKIKKIAENIAKYPDINQAIAAYNLGDAGLAEKLGPGYTHYTSGLDAYGQNYINKFVKNLDPQLVQQLGFKPSPPEEEKKIEDLIRAEQERKRLAALELKKKNKK